MLARAAHAAWKRGWRRKNRSKLAAGRGRILEAKRQIKSGPCVDCGKSYPAIAMEFDHLPGSDKHFKVSLNSVTLRSAVVEIAKCEIVCVLCHRDRTHERYQLSDSVTSKKKRALRAKVNELKKRPCETCNVQYDPWKMDFDHLDPATKSEKISDMVRRRASLASILEEVSKCRLLCALCHRLWSEEQANAS